MKNFLLIDDHEVIRTGVKQVLEELYKPCSIFEAVDQQSAVRELKERRYDLILLDVQMPDSNAVGLMEHISATYADARVLVFSMSAENVYAQKFFKAGAWGYISKSAGVTELRKAIDLVLLGRKYISKSLGVQLAIDYVNGEVDNPFKKLSPREFEIASLLSLGESVTKISGLLSLSTSTVGTHKAHIYGKLGVKNLVELIEIGKVYQLQ